MNNCESLNEYFLIRLTAKKGRNPFSKVNDSVKGEKVYSQQDDDAGRIHMMPFFHHHPYTYALSLSHSLPSPTSLSLTHLDTYTCTCVRLFCMYLHTEKLESGKIVWIHLERDVFKVFRDRLIAKSANFLNVGIFLWCVFSFLSNNLISNNSSLLSWIKTRLGVDMQADHKTTNTFNRRKLTIRESITLRLTSCLTDLDLTKQVKLMLIQYWQSSWIQTKLTGGQTYFPLRLVFSAFN